jgi:hypothetical protein
MLVAGIVVKICCASDARSGVCVCVCVRALFFLSKLNCIAGLKNEEILVLKVDPVSKWPNIAPSLVCRQGSRPDPT